ncbi:sensor histidine kinase [Bacteroidota bacterium]
MRALYKLLLSCLFLLGSLNGNAQEWSPAEKGILDLRNYQFNEHSQIKLNGEWEFYWEDFVMPQELHSANPPSPTLYAKVTGYWIDYSNEEITFPGTGYGSYRLRILLPEGFNQNIVIDMPVFDVAVRVYFDGQEMYTSGRPGTSEELSEAAYLPATIFHLPATDTMEILLHVSNFQHRRGGFWKSMQIGHPTMILKSKQRYRLIGNISLGMLLAFSLFFFFFYLFYRKDKVVLAFSLVLAGVFVRMMNTDLYPINYVMDISWEWIIRLEYIGTFFAFGAALWYFHRLFPARYMLWIVRINTIIVILAGIVILLFKVKVFSYTMLYFQPAVVAVMLYYLLACAWSIYKGDREKILFMAGMLVFLGGLVNDILVANSVTAISNSYIIHFALQFFVFIQAILIIRTWIRAYIEREKLLGEIAYINKNLETLVDQRTLEVNRRNREIQRKNVDIEARNKELNEALDFKNRVFSIIAHDLKSPVASLVQNSALLDYNLTKEENKRLLISFRELSSSALNLIDNLLYWGRSQGDQLTSHPELIDIAIVIENVLKLYSEMARQKDISLELEAKGKSTAFVDKELLEITFRNLLSNAIKFTGKGGRVTVSISDEAVDNMLFIIIKDNGMGIPEDRLEHILDAADMISTAGTEKEKGTGLGLRLCNELVHVNKGELKIESVEGEGTTVSFSLRVSEPPS